jgi:hypothetical protein
MPCDRTLKPEPCRSTTKPLSASGILYHKRSNVESTFSAIKRKFGDSVMSKNPVAMVNEVLCKILCHNLTCLIQEQETLGIVPIFWKDEEQVDGERVILSITQSR